MAQKKVAALTAIFLLSLIAIFILHRLGLKPIIPFLESSPSLVYLEKKKEQGKAGERTKLVITLQNKTKSTWASQGKNPVYLSYHLFNQRHQLLQFDNERFRLPRPLKPGKEIVLNVHLRNPLQPGTYFLKFDLVKEGLFWFKDKGFKPKVIKLEILPLSFPEDKKPWTIKASPLTKLEFSSPEYSSLWQLIRLTWQKNRVSFLLGQEKVSGFKAGLNYPQIWLRDSTVFLPVVSYLYPSPFLKSWLEAHLSFQQPDGALFDWLDENGQRGKNTTETDQESSAVQAAYLVSQLIGQEWLSTPIKGEKLIERLERALRFVLQKRWSTKYNLVQGAHTIDWGDVDLIDPNQQAIITDERTKWTVDIYDQAMFYLACQNISHLWSQLKAKEKSQFWAKIAHQVKRNTHKWLWDERRGYFIIHRHNSSWSHPFPEEDIFPVGGNIMAILAGLASPLQAESILSVLFQRKAKYNLPTVSATLLPPYPPQTFKHPLVDEPFEYQNGGQWDWWGGRAVLALFQHGHSLKAKQSLAEIIAQIRQNRGLFEWATKDGVAQGSDYFTASAGALGQALIEGYLGVDLTSNNLRLCPRVGQDSVKIHLYQPSTGQFVAYAYQYQKPGTISFLYNSSLIGQGFIQLLLPLEMKGRKLRVLLDGQPINFQLLTQGEDIYLQIHSDYREHLLEVILVDN